MKTTIRMMIFVFVLAFAACSNKQKEQAQEQSPNQNSISTANSPNTVGSTVQVEKNLKSETAKIERRKRIQAENTFSREKAEAALEENIKEGKAFLISDENESIPLRMEGSKVMAMTMPDGKLYPAEMDGNKAYVTIPGKGKMERKIINRKIYLVDNDDKMYEVKVIDKKLVAVLTDRTEMKLAKK
jgi:glucose/arabinose dehydrogenase